MTHSKTLLLVDAESTSLQQLEHILQHDYRLLFAHDGRTALQVSQEQRPDLILLAVQLPELNGYEVCQALQQDSRTAEIPVIFVSHLSEVIDEAHGFEAGGVDYITKPVSPPIVKARIATHLSLVHRLKEVEHTKEYLHQTNAALEVYKQRSEYELDKARELMDHMIARYSAPVEGVELWLKAAENMSGDMILTQKYFGQRSYILHADAMGHGVPAALPLIPIAQTFSAMAKNGYTVPAIIRETNDKIIDLIPLGNFVALTLVSIDYRNHLVEIWNGGNPPALAFNQSRDILNKFSSHHCALGIIRDSDFDPSAELFHWDESCWLMMYSDGLTEARNTQGECFGEERIISSLSGHDSHHSIKNSILEHLEGRDAHDDVSIVTVALNDPRNSRRL